MDVSSFLGGNFLTHLDLPQQAVVWTITNVQQQLIGTDQKICVQFQQHAKQLGLNKTNLRAVANAYGTNAQAWIGKALELYRDQTFFQGRQTPCIRVRIPAAVMPQAQAYQQQPAAPQQPPGVSASPGSPPWGSL